MKFFQHLVGLNPKPSDDCLTRVGKLFCPRVPSDFSSSFIEKHESWCPCTVLNAIDPAFHYFDAPELSQVMPE